MPVNMTVNATPKPLRNRLMQALAGVSALCFLASAGHLALATEPSETPRSREVRPSYDRSPEKRPAAAKSAPRKAMPDALRRAKSAPPLSVEKHGAVGTRPSHGVRSDVLIDRGPTRQDDRLTERAREAAAWAAERVLFDEGRQAYYRAGFFLGQRGALNDAGLGAWDFREGRRFAKRDPEARRVGRAEGRDAAGAVAWSQAEVRVHDQFTDLSRDPLFDDRTAVPAFAPQSRRLAAPTLRETFAAFPLSEFDFGPRAGLLRGASIDALQLSRCASVSDVFHRNWDDPKAAFRDWKANPGRARFYIKLDAEDRKRFRTVFRASLERQIDRELDRQRDRRGASVLERAFDRGQTDGFDYGAFIRQELDYRRGYFEGFQTALDRAAEQGFVRAFPQSYRQAYDALFTEWTDNPKPAIGEVRLVDASGDGVFEPGEDVILETELINYGGSDGRFPIRVAGSVLSSGGATQRGLVLPARSVTWDRQLTASIRRGTPNRTRDNLAVRLADQSTTVALTVSRPLQFVPGSLRVVQRNLQGEVRVEIDLENQSRVTRDGAIRLTASAPAGLPDRVKIVGLEPGYVTTLTLDAVGLPVLDLIAGEVRLDLRATSGGVEQDTAVYQVPDVVRDLNNGDLLEYVVRLSRDPDAPRSEVAQARALFLERLQVDWRRAVRQSGNPYKADFRRGGTRTELGTWVQTAQATGNAGVFQGLSGEVRALAGDLPGPHPFLRKYMRKLARELP